MIIAAFILTERRNLIIGLFTYEQARAHERLSPIASVFLHGRGYVCLRLNPSG
jgi:hypothetical protein